MTADLVLNNSVELPPIGLGVFQTPPEETRSAVEAALSVAPEAITLEKYGRVIPEAD